MENKSVILGKIDKKVCFLNNGQYGYYLTLNKVNYKLPGWMPHDKMDIDIAKRLIEYKQEMSQQYLITKEKLEKTEAEELEKRKNEEEEEESTEEESRKMVLTKTKK